MAGATSENMSLSTRALHGDRSHRFLQDAAPALHLATAFTYDEDPDRLIPIPDRQVS
jgi:hypothetical protein